MSENVSALEKIDRILNIVTKMSRKVDFLEKKIEEALYEDDDDGEFHTPTQEAQTISQNDTDYPSIETIKKLGQKIPYLKYSGSDADKFREFLVHMKTRPDIFSETEIVTAGIADKTYDDIHVSANTYRLLNQSYKKTHNSRDMPWRNTTGFLYRYGYHKHWEWDE